MKHLSIKNGQLFFKLILLALLLSTTFTKAQNNDGKTFNETKIFDGFYLGINAGNQNIFGGAFIDDLDVLAQESKFVFEFTPGYRAQFLNNRLVVGGELLFGLTDGNLSTIDNRNQKIVNYENNKQKGYGFNLGTTLGKQKKLLMYTFLQVINRDFEVAIIDPDGTTFNQKDGQKFGRYGLGFEFPIYKRFHIKSTLALTTVDFGDLETNIDVEDKMDFNIGINYQF